VSSKLIDMTDQKPYYIRALWEWMVDNKVRPHVLINTKHPGVVCPPQLKLQPTTFNISDAACAMLNISNHQITGSMRFNGKACPITFPLDSVLAIFSNDEPCRGKGMQFPDVMPQGILEQAATAAVDEPASESTEEIPPSPTPETPPEKNRPSWLKVVK
jgi:stringent starvation protein B